MNGEQNPNPVPNNNPILTTLRMILLAIYKGLRLLGKENQPYIFCQKLTVDSAGTAKQFPKLRIPRGMEVVIEALSDNSDYVYVGNRKADAEDRARSFPLLPGASIAYEIRRLEQLWLDSVVDEEGVVITVELDASKNDMKYEEEEEDNG